MSGKGLFVAMLAVATILAVSAAGQKNEVGGLLRRTFVSDQGIPGATFSDPIMHSGKGLTIGGQYAPAVLGGSGLLDLGGRIVHLQLGCGLERGRLRALGGSCGSQEPVHHACGTRESVSHNGGFSPDQLGSRIGTRQPE
jgi:hypothetical protein